MDGERGLAGGHGGWSLGESANGMGGSEDVLDTSMEALGAKPWEVVGVLIKDEEPNVGEVVGGIDIDVDGGEVEGLIDVGDDRGGHR